MKLQQIQTAFILALFIFTALTLVEEYKLRMNLNDHADALAEAKSQIVELEKNELELLILLESTNFYDVEQ